MLAMIGTTIMSVKLLKAGILYRVKKTWETDDKTVMMLDSCIIPVKISEKNLTTSIIWLMPDGRAISDTWTFVSREKKDNFYYEWFSKFLQCLLVN